MPEEMRVEAMELCVTACEKYATNNEVLAIPEKSVPDNPPHRLAFLSLCIIGEGTHTSVLNSNILFCLSSLNKITRQVMQVPSFFTPASDNVL